MLDGPCSMLDALGMQQSAPSFDWPLAYPAEEALRAWAEAFLIRNHWAQSFANRLRTETGTDFFEWIDHLTVGPEQTAQLEELGFVREKLDAPAGSVVYQYPRVLLPRVVVRADGIQNGAPRHLAIRPELLADFVRAHDLGLIIQGKIGSRYREALVSEEDGHKLWAVERLAWRHFVPEPVRPEQAAGIEEVREIWRARKRDFASDQAGANHAVYCQEQSIARVGADIATELFFAEERRYWESRNAAARLQKRRQDVLGLGWGNHDHHTFRSSRQLFARLIRFLTHFGFQKRERYYAGAEAGWGAQILEHPVTGITVFADVDLLPEETEIDFSVQPLPAADRLRTVGLWCALHGDSWLQAGMHHLEARFDFELLRDQLAGEGVGMMKPFSNFEFLKQAFTAGERWPVRPERLGDLQAKGLITAEQAGIFAREGAVGSHLENLQRKGGFKGFNQKSVSVIIAATDPRSLAATH